MKDEQRKVNVEEHPEYSLGDTHFTVAQIADETGLCRSCITKHIKSGRLKDCTTLTLREIGLPLAVEYDAALHDFFEHPRAWRIDREKAVEMLQTHTPKEVAEAMRCPRRSITRICEDDDYDTPSWGHQWKEEAAYTRQLYAQALTDSGYSRAEIAHALDRHMSTVDKYRAGIHSRPEKIEGRTPLWELSPQEHGLWDPERDPRTHS